MLVDDPSPRSNQYTFLEPVEESLPHLPPLAPLLEQGKAGCQPFHPEDLDCSGDHMTCLHMCYHLSRILHPVLPLGPAAGTLPGPAGSQTC